MKWKCHQWLPPGDTNRLKLVSCAKKYIIGQKTDFGDLKVLSVTTKDTSIFIFNPQNNAYIVHILIRVIDRNIEY